MEVPRHWRTQQWRYGLRVSVDALAGEVNDVPAEVKRQFVDTGLETKPRITADATVAMSLPVLLSQE